MINRKNKRRDTSVKKFQKKYFADIIPGINQNGLKILYLKFQDISFSGKPFFYICNNKRFIRIEKG